MEQPPLYAAAFTGKHSLWRYISGMALILITWLVIGSIVTAVLLILVAVVRDVNLTELADPANWASSLGFIPYYLVLNISFFFLFGGIWLAVVLIHERPLRSLVTPRPAIRWKRMIFGGLVWLAFAAATSLIEVLIWPETFTFQLDLAVFLPFAVLVLLMTPIQAVSEELLFRGYLLQASSLFTRRPIALAIISGLLFMLPHLFNPEMAVNFGVMALSYFAFGAFLAWISLRDGTIELAIGAHVANNLFAILVITFPESAIPSPAIFLTTHFDPVFSLATQLIVFGLYYLLVFAWPARRQVAIQN